VQFPIGSKLYYKEGGITGPVTRPVGVYGGFDVNVNTVEVGDLTPQLLAQMRGAGLKIICLIATERSLQKTDDQLLELAFEQGCDGILIPEYLPTARGVIANLDARVQYLRNLAAKANARGLAFGYWGDVNLALNVVEQSQFGFVFDCITNNNCPSYSPFRNAGKAMFVVDRFPKINLCQYFATYLPFDYQFKVIPSDAGSTRCN
jgi:hypothetical protein